MFAMMSLLAIALGVPTWGAGSGERNAPIVPEAPAEVLLTALAEIVDDDQDAEAPQPPKLWIGVRLAPVPEALAAHVGAQGMMIANIVAGSPAEQVGLDRYDIILEFNGKPVNDMQSLLDAIGDASADRAAALRVLRTGKPETVALTPAPRPTHAEVQYKYEEPDVTTSQTGGPNYFGFRSRLDPSGRMIMEPLGRLSQLPDALLHGQLPQVQIFRSDDMLRNLGPDMWSWTLSPPTPGAQNAPGGADVEVRVRVDDNGETISVQRSGDGPISVERTKDGISKTATYDDVEALRVGDKEAARLYEQVDGRRGFSIVAPPDLPALQQRQREFQNELQRRTEKRRRVDGAPHSTMTRSQSTSITIGDDGAIEIRIREGGREQVHRYANREELKTGNPELYERFQSMLEE